MQSIGSVLIVFGFIMFAGGFLYQAVRFGDDFNSDQTDGMMVVGLVTFVLGLILWVS